MKNIGLGMMRMPQNQIEISNIIDFCYNNNIRYFESCSFYIDNNCDFLLGQNLKKFPRNSYVLCEKIHWIQDLSKIEEFFNSQLKTLSTDYFDIYLIQCIDRRYFSKNFIPIERFNIIYNFLLKKKQEGKIKKLGFSFHDTSLYLEYLLKNYKWDCIQLQLNYYDWYEGEAKKLYILCKQYNLPVFVMQGLKGGLLGDINGLDSSLAYKFLNTLSQVDTILNGSSNIAQIKNNITLIQNNEKLNQNDLLQIKQNIDYIKKQGFINCSNCNYCKNHCSQSINISKTFDMYNKALLNKININEYKNFIEFDKNSPKRCISCKQCEQYCPQHLPISYLLNNKIIEYKKV